MAVSSKTPMDDQDRQQKRTTLAWLAPLLGLIAVAAAIAAGIWYRGRERKRLAARRPAAPPPIIPVEGLTEAEAEARQVEGQDNVIRLKPPRTKRQMWQENVLNLFNLNLVGLAGAQLLLHRPLDALLSLGTIALNAGLNIGQELLAQRRLRDIEQRTRPQATVVREEKVRSIDPSEIVVGDALVLGPGDQILVDGELIGEGQIVVDESVLTGDSARRSKYPGDKVYAGSYCLSGRAACLVERVGSARTITGRLAEMPSAQEELTAIERLIQRVLRILLVVVAVFTAFLLFRYFKWDTGPVPADAANEVISLVFSIAPVTLFFMIIVTYASGTADLGRLGAMVHRARSVETLAQASVICFAKAGILTGTHVEIELTEPREEEERLAESRLRQILGDYARTASIDSLAVGAMASTFEGSRRIAVEEAPFLSVYGWSAVAFDDDDLRGVYVLAEPEVLAAHLAVADGEAPEEKDQGSAIDSVRSAISPLGRLFRRGKEEPDEEAVTTAKYESPEDHSLPASVEASEPGVASDAKEVAGPLAEGKANQPAVETQADEDKEGAGKRVRGFFRGLGQRVGHILRREKEEEDSEGDEEEQEREEATLAFAYIPDLAPLHDEEGRPQLPSGLISLCSLHYSQRVRPEAVETIKLFTDTGVDVKVFSTIAGGPTAKILKQAGLTTTEGFDLQTISGKELAQFGPAELAGAVAANAIFGEISPEQAGRVVAALRKSGETVAVVGDGVGDLPALRQASLAISRQSSTQATLSIADIILLEDSPKVLGAVLAKGQRIVNGLLDILKLNLTHVICLAILLIAIPLFAEGYPYRSSQGGIISVMTVAIPSLGLTLGAAAGVLPSAKLGRLLARFVVPAGITIAAAALIVYLVFFDRTGEIRYAQLGVTYTLVACGLWLIVFVKPLRAVPWSGSAPTGAWWPVAMALVLMPVFVLICAIPLAQELLKVNLLREPTDYWIVGIAFLAWAITLRLVLRLIPVKSQA
jgi:magnesium-transporting ATPase (P-type)